MGKSIIDEFVAGLEKESIWDEVADLSHFDDEDLEIMTSGMKRKSKSESIPKKVASKPKKK